MTDFIEPVPEDRSIVPGMWSDVLDKWLAAFEVDGDEVKLKTALSSLGVAEAFFLKELGRLNSVNKDILQQLRLMNMRLESALETTIDEKDVRRP